MAQFQKFMFDNFVIDCDKEDVVVEPEVEAEPEVVVVEAEPVEENIVSEPEIVAEPEIVVEPVVSYSQEEMDDAVRKAEETGYERGFRQAESEAEQRQEALMNEMNGKLSMMLADMATENSERENEAVQMALALVKKLLPSLEVQQAEAEVQKFLADNFSNFRREAHLSFAFNPQTVGAAAKIIAKLAEKNDFEGKISVHKDENLAAGDCRIEWENGGVEKNSRKMLEKAEKLLDDNTMKNEEREHG